jgi:hypothetical protein
LESGVESVLNDVALSLDEKLASFQELLELASEHDRLGKEQG